MGILFDILSPKYLKAQAIGLYKKLLAIIKLLQDRKKLRKIMRDETFEPHIHLATLIVATLIVAVILVIISGVLIRP
jgi:hypothetical protein